MNKAAITTLCTILATSLQRRAYTVASKNYARLTSVLKGSILHTSIAFSSRFVQTSFAPKLIKVIR